MQTPLLSLTPEIVGKIFDAMPFGIDIVDEQLNIRYMNQNFIDRFGSDAIGQKCYDIYRDDKKQCPYCPLRKSIAIGETKTIETGGVDHGKTFVVTHTGIELNGEKLILEVFIDISAEKEKQQRIAQLNKKGVEREFHMVDLQGEIEELKTKLDEFSHDALKGGKA